LNAITTVAAASPLVSFIERAASDPDFSLEKFEALLRMQREEQARIAEREFNSAMAEAQGEMEPVRKSALNTHIGNKYATFEAIDAALRPIYTRHGFSVRFKTEDAAQPGWVKVICVISHSGGHVELFPLQAPLDSAGSGGKTNKTGVQAIGSTTSYLKRYLLTLALNVAVAGDDDDGEASRRQAAPARPYLERRMDPVASMNRMSREELDAATEGDEPRPPPVDKAAVGVQALEAQIRAAATEEELHAIAGSPQVEKQRSWLAKHRPELDQMLADTLGERYQQLVQARLEAEEADPSLMLDRPSPPLAATA
jgi:hypothetical protein